jgi:hypothetical protein
MDSILLAQEEIFMHLHANAKLTLKQRQEIRRLHQEEYVSLTTLATRFQVNWKTAAKWAHRDTAHDSSSAPRHPRTVITEAYRTAVIAYRQAHPAHGPIRIAQGLRATFPQARRETIRQILHQAKLIPPAAPRPKPKPIPVGRHRVQMDIQQLPAIEGQTGFEYKISVIHLGTRLKYSEIHQDSRSKTVAGVLRRACDRLPPFFSS